MIMPIVVFLFIAQFLLSDSFHDFPLPLQSTAHGTREIKNGLRSPHLGTCHHKSRNSFPLASVSNNLDTALSVLHKFDEEYIERMKSTRKSTGEGTGNGGLVEVKTPKQVEFERAQILKVVVM